ncbi:hypothetical protein EBU95_18530 [bacterium]|nr:hypothetical protein [bacterium]
MDINFIITCYNREDYWPYLKQILENYKLIKPHIAYCYSGVKDDVVCDFKCENRGHIEGDTDLMIGGYNVLKNNGVKNWVKLSVDSWMLDEQKVIDIFNIMEYNDLVYAGNRWTGDPWWSTDMFFSRDNEFEFMKKFTEGALNYIENVDYSIEGWIANLAKESGKYYIIPEREPITGNTGTRFCVDELSWTMKHDLNENLATAKYFIDRLKQTNNA